jgi:hypothetical protein
VSVLVVAGGISWWVVQQTTGAGNAATTNTPPPSKKLNISLIPSSNDVHVGDDLKIVAEVSNSNGQQLGTGQCALHWKDSKTSWAPTTTCDGPGIERSVPKAGVHDITATAQGLGGLRAHGRSAAPSGHRQQLKGPDAPLCIPRGGGADLQTQAFL